jgi:hypothetical protein
MTTFPADARRRSPQRAAASPAAAAAPSMPQETLTASTIVWPLPVAANGATAAAAQHGVVLASGEVIDFAALLDRTLRAAGSDSGLMPRVWLTSWRSRMLTDPDPVDGR